MKTSKGGNQKPYIKEEQTTQWPKEKVQKDKQRSTKHTHKTKDRNLYIMFDFLFGDSSFYLINSRVNLHYRFTITICFFQNILPQKRIVQGVRNSLKI